MKFRNNEMIVVNFGDNLTDGEKRTLKKNYRLHDDGITEINYRCRGWTRSSKSIYLQCVDWIELIPNRVINNNEFVLKLPETLPKEIAIYMIMEVFSRTGRHPRIMEYRDSELNRVVDLEYEVNFSKKKREDVKEENYNSDLYHQ